MPLGDGGALPRRARVAAATLARLRRAGFDYACFKVFALPLNRAATSGEVSLPSGYRFAEVSPADLQACPFPELQDCREYCGVGSHTFGIFRDDGILACVQCIWFGERYWENGFWPIEADAAVSMHLVTATPEQGKGLATRLKQCSARRMREEGFSRLYSRIWWTNTPSLRVSEKAGWSRVGTIFEVSLPWTDRPLRWLIPRKEG
jgi:GNAT superfamily N-acetyltransferase